MVLACVSLLARPSSSNFLSLFWQLSIFHVWFFLAEIRRFLALKTSAEMPPSLPGLGFLLLVGEYCWESDTCFGKIFLTSICSCKNS